METHSKAANLVQRLSSKHPEERHCGRWALPIAGAVLLILAAGSVVLVVDWDMFKHTQPLPTSTVTLSLPPERSLATAAGKPLCITRGIETMPMPNRTCISKN